jgi:glycosyltransferase involved in cell wall biosynthesis/membrane-associated phospholipid phosphatase
VLLADADFNLAERANDFAAAHDAWADAARAYASASEPLFVAGLALLIIAGLVFRRRRLVVAGAFALASAGVGLAVAWVVAQAVDRPRPFVAHRAIHAFLPHAADASFPSDHVTAAFAIGSALVLRLGFRWTPVLVAAALLAVARVVVGVHYPSDVVAGALIGTAAAVAVYLVVPRIRQVIENGVWTNRIGMAVLGALLNLRPREKPDSGARPKVHLLAWNSWAMGGTVRTTLNLASYLARDREVEVISVVGSDGDPFFEHPPGVRVTRLHRPPRGRLERFLHARRSVLMHPGDRAHERSSLLVDVRMVRQLWRIRSGVVIGTRPALNLFAIAARRRGVMAIGWEHMNLRKHRPAMKAEIRRSYPRLDALVVLTRGDRDAYAEALGDRLRIDVIANAVPAMPGPPSPLSEPVILAAGRLTPQKGFDLLAAAFALIAEDAPEWTIRICGDGPKRDGIEAAIAEHGLEGRVVLAGRCMRIWEEMERASVYALSSRFEGFPMVLVEAMSKGLPIVAFDCPTGPREVVHSGQNGFLVPHKDAESFASALLTVIRDAELRTKLGAGAVEEARRYSLEKIGARWDALFAGVTPDGDLVPSAGSVAPRRVS